MGYTTDFAGEFTVTPPLKTEHSNYLRKFAETRRMARKAAALRQRPDPLRLAAGLPLGDQGGYFVGADADFGQERTSDILDHNTPPKWQPGLWCQWVPTHDGTAIEWDGGEKFYNYVEWLEYIVEHFLKRWGYVLNGEVEWQGEDSCDRGTIYVKDNKIEAVEDDISNRGPSWA